MNVYGAMGPHRKMSAAMQAPAAGWAARALVLMLVIAGLAGCFPVDDEELSQLPPTGASASEEPGTTETLAADGTLLGDANGDGKLSDLEARVLAKSNYTMPDGTVVPIPKGQPVPQEVIDAVRDTLQPLVQAYNDEVAASDGTADAEIALAAGLQDQSNKTVRTIILILHTQSGWTVSSPVAKSFGTSEEAVAAAQAYIGDRTESYLLVAGN